MILQTGTHGLAISFVDSEEMKFVDILQTQYKIDLKPFPEELSDLHHQRPLATEKEQNAFKQLQTIRDQIKLAAEDIPVVFTELGEQSSSLEGNYDATESEQPPKQTFHPFPPPLPFDYNYSIGWDYRWNQPQPPDHITYNCDFIPPDLPF